MSKQEKLIYKKLFIDSVNRGLADLVSGKVYTTEELKEALEQRRIQRARD